MVEFLLGVVIGLAFGLAAGAVLGAGGLIGVALWTTRRDFARQKHGGDGDGKETVRKVIRAGWTGNG